MGKAGTNIKPIFCNDPYPSVIGVGYIVLFVLSCVFVAPDQILDDIHPGFPD